MRRLTVHIGAPKTGSTYLQRLLYENRERLLREQGILYPDVSLRGFGHHDIAFLIGGGYPDWAIPQHRPLQALLDDLKQAVSAHDGSIVLSSENFYLFPDPQRLQAALLQTGASTGREVRILVYIRRQDDAHESWYNQIVKAQGATCAIDACIERHFGLWDYHARLGQWAGVFGRESISVRPYDRAWFDGGNLRSDFLAHAGIADRDLASPPPDVNWSLNRDLLAFQRMLNWLPVSPVNKRRFHRQLMELGRQSAGTGMFSETPLLDAAARRDLLERYRESNTAIAADYLGGRPAFGAASQGGAPAGAGPGLTLPKLARIVAWLWRNRGQGRGS